MSFNDLFQAATGNDPYEYQRRLACGERNSRAVNDWLCSGTDCASRLISIPTGLGKTAAVTLAWLWNRIMCDNESWPRRLVYCLPMRTLVEQTRDEIQCWLNTLANKYPHNSGLTWLVSHSPVILMGGEENDAARSGWDIHPEKPAILVGTQDMLLSRALNRGYGMSRARWPMHFGLLNNDCLWVLDETQLMGAGVGTAAQLEGLRNEFKTFPSSDRPSTTWYVSATQNSAHIETREWRGKNRPDHFFFSLSETEKAVATGKLAERRLARKHLELHEDWNFADFALKVRAEEILSRHRAMIAKFNGGSVKQPRRTLIICNTVRRAVAVHSALENAISGGGESLLLLHSRFRQREREAQRDGLSAPILSQGQIVVSTQVIEAGVNLSSAILWTEIAPLASLVQRLGRLNRAGEFDQCPDISFAPLCVVVGLDLKPAEGNKEQRNKAEKENVKKCLPYKFDTCQAAWETLRTIPNGNASPAAFEEPEIVAVVAASIPEIPYSLQRHELLDFFDTDANLSLGYTDVSPFVRGLDEDTDVHILWRDALNDGAEPSGAPDFQRDEICAVPISQAKDAAAILNKGWFWRGKEAGWASVRDTGVFPGMTVVLSSDAGGYSAKLGWTGQAADKPDDVHRLTETATDEDLLAFISNGWQSIDEHTGDVRAVFDAILATLPANTFTDAERDAMKHGIDWHDVGKNHPRWQNAAREALAKAEIVDEKFGAKLPLGKFSLADSPLLLDETGNHLTDDALKCKVRKLQNAFRPGLAHEVASALAFRQSERQTGALRSPASLLAEYLVISHHGHVRKVLRDELPHHLGEAKDAETVRGVGDGDAIPPVAINGQQLGCAAVSTDCRRMGRDAAGNESYTRGVLRLLAHYGPFRLAFLETLFRAADCRASRQAAQSDNTEETKQ
jgi:CRISPR-associated endonuclease/helicase Cas3